MEPMYAWAMIIIGLGLIVYYAKTKVSVGHPAVVPLIAMALIVAPFAMGWVALPTATPDAGTYLPGTPTAQAGTFDLTHAAGYDCNFNTDTNVLNIPVTVNITANTVTPLNGAINTSIRAIPPIGATTTNLAVLYYETDYLMQFDGEYILSQSGGYYLAEYDDSNNGEGYYKGQIAMAYTDTDWVNITYTLDNGTGSWCAEVDDGDLYSTIASWNIRFSNGAGWSESVRVNLIVTTIDE